MEDTKMNTVLIGDKEYNFEDFTEIQTLLVRHSMDLNKEITEKKFKLEQLEFSRNAFIDALVQELNKDEKGEK